MYLLIIFLPFISSLSLLLFGRLLGRCGSGQVSVITIGVAFLSSLMVTYEVVLSGSICQVDLGLWLPLRVSDVNLVFTFDVIVCMMLNLVTLVALLVHQYSREYMAGDPYLGRFLSYLSLFTFSMLILVTAGNLIQMFFGWEGVGLSSYLLINFWFTRVQANKSAFKAMFVNRIGDLGLLLGIFLFYTIFGSLKYDVINSLVAVVAALKFLFLGLNFAVLDLICILVFFGVAAKSAQLGLHVWLPDAMEGPTPVSALIHAATMVTAGVFLVIRLSPVFEHSSLGLTLLIFFGSLTALVASVIGSFQNDIKKIVAYSTCSQLGYMVLSCGLSLYSLSLFHLFNHGFFKALLFLGAGSVIHAYLDNQDIRRMGAFLNVLPLTYLMILVGSLSLMAVPFFSGFYTKDLIIESAGSYYSPVGLFAAIFSLVAALFTTFYSLKLIYLVFFSKPNGYKILYRYMVESGFDIVLSITILFFLTVFSGYMFKNIFLGYYFDQSAMLVLSPNAVFFTSEYFSGIVKQLPLIFMGLAIVGFFLLSSFASCFTNFNKCFHLIYFFIAKKLSFDLIYNSLIVKLFWFSSYFFYNLLDKVFLSVPGLGLYRFFVEKLSQGILVVVSGFVYHYIFLLSFGFVLWGIIGFMELLDGRLLCFMLVSTGFIIMSEYTNSIITNNYRIKRKSYNSHERDEC